MKLLPMTSRRARWAVPAGAIAVVAALTAASMATAAASPALPAQTPAQLLTAFAEHAGALPPMSGTVTETADLGIPQLPGEQDSASVLSLLTGSHTITFAYADPAHYRLALPVPMGETDVIRNGRTVWIWQSKSDSVQRVTLPPGSGYGGPEPAGPGSKVPLTPQQAAQQLLAALGPTTSVTTGSTTTVAGQDAYQLVIVPRDSRSLVGSVVIALDAAHPAIVLQVQVFARGAASPAFQTGYTAISFGTPPASTFGFTPPPGAKVHAITAPAGPPVGWTGLTPGSAALNGVVVKDMPACAELPNVPVKRSLLCPGPRALTAQECRALQAALVKGVPPSALKGLPAAARKALAAQLKLHVSVKSSAVGCSVSVISGKGVVAGGAFSNGLIEQPGGGPPPCSARLVKSCTAGVAPFGGPQVIGSGWLSVLVLPAAALSGLPSAGGAAGALGHAAGSAAGAPGAAITGGDGAAILAALLRSATPVHGAWGSGRLLRTSLLSVLVTSNGHVLIGAVTPSVLYAAAGQVK